MNAFLATIAGLFFLFCVISLLGLEREPPARPGSRRARIAIALVDGGLCAWALWLLCGRWGVV